MAGGRWADLPVGKRQAAIVRGGPAVSAQGPVEEHFARAGRDLFAAPGHDVRADPETVRLPRGKRREMNVAALDLRPDIADAVKADIGKRAGRWLIPPQRKRAPPLRLRASAEWIMPASSMRPGWEPERIVEGQRDTIPDITRRRICQCGGTREWPSRTPSSLPGRSAAPGGGS